MKNMNPLLVLASLAVASPALAQGLDFGGMYGYGNYRNYPNPYTGGLSCPSGYAAYQALGTPNADNRLFYCGRVPNGTTPVADFGGVYGYGGNQDYPNPVTGDMSCPTGFTATQVYGTVNVDHPLFVCHRKGTSTRVVQFGGMQGDYYSASSPTGWLTYPNPLTATGSCPTGFSAVRALETYLVDYRLMVCYL